MQIFISLQRRREMRKASVSPTPQLRRGGSEGEQLASKATHVGLSHFTTNGSRPHPQTMRGTTVHTEENILCSVPFPVPTKVFKYIYSLIIGIPKNLNLAKLKLVLGFILLTLLLVFQLRLLGLFLLGLFLL